MADPTDARSRRLLLHVFSSFGMGGAQVRFAAIVNRLGRRYRHRVLAMDGVYDCGELLDDDIDVEIAEVGVGSGSVLTHAWAFRRALKAVRPAVLVTYNWGAIEWALANIVTVCPHLHIEDGFGPDEAVRQFRRRVLFRRLVLSRCSKVVLPSQTLHEIAATVWRIDRRRLAYIPNGIDLERFAVAPDPAFVASLGLAPGEPVVGTVAALRREKNLGRLLRAFVRVNAAQPARLVIVGDGPERAALEAEAARYGIARRVVFTGRIPDPERLYGAFDVFALSSDTEQMPLSVLEAMAAGLPVAAVDVGDVRAMVSAENRPLIVPRDERQLGEAIIKLIRYPGRRISIGHANRMRASRDFGQARMVSAYDRLFSM
ncbi:MAG: glycosyltransferase [Alphaproteobacteria bacterium]